MKESKREMQRIKSGSPDKNGKMRNPSKLRMKQLGSYLVPFVSGAGYRHDSDLKGRLSEDRLVYVH